MGNESVLFDSFLLEAAELSSGLICCLREQGVGGPGGCLVFSFA